MEDDTKQEKKKLMKAFETEVDFYFWHILSEFVKRQAKEETEWCWHKQ